jgi:hypothetical protein
MTGGRKISLTSILAILALGFLGLGLDMAVIQSVYALKHALFDVGNLSPEHGRNLGLVTQRHRQLVPIACLAHEIGPLMLSVVPRTRTVSWAIAA